ncbi:MAG: GTP-binding protein [Asgard group archaeon]|nr:GTP-binding protein [Asgard group archaeon]
MSFLRNLFKRRTREVDITICGLANAGKTTIVKYLETGRFVETQPTMGINRAETIQIEKLEFNIYDLGGQEDFQVLWPEVNEKSDGVVFVVDKSDVMNFEKARQTFQNIVDAQIQKDVIVLILLHKCDKPDGMDRSRFIKEFGLLDLSYKWACYETSAKTGENIFESFRWFFDQLKDEVG